MLADVLPVEAQATLVFDPEPLQPDVSRNLIRVMQRCPALDQTDSLIDSKIGVYPISEAPNTAIAESARRQSGWHRIVLNF
jgi:hypothetical protein